MSTTPVRDIPANYQALEKQAYTFHAKQAADATQIFLDGFNMLLLGLEALRGHNFGTATEQRVMMALFIETLNSLRCFYELATRGYFIQSLNLLRTPVEDWMAYWFLQPALAPGKRERAWLKQLHQYSHLSRVGVRAIMTIDEKFTNYQLGPAEDEGRFRLCIAEALQVIGAHLEALDNFRQLNGAPPIQDFPAYINRVETWQRAQRSIVDALERSRTKATKQPA